MPPKKDAPASDNSITGYDGKETKLLAAAFVSSTGPDKYDYVLFAKLTGFTEGTLKKFWPPLKRKVIEEHSNFGAFINSGPAAAATTSSKATGSKKRKAEAEPATESDPNAPSADIVHGKEPSDKTKKATTKGKRGKKVKSEETAEEKAEEESVDGGDDLDKA